MSTLVTVVSLLSSLFVRNCLDTSLAKKEQLTSGDAIATYINTLFQLRVFSIVSTNIILKKALSNHKKKAKDDAKSKVN